LLGDYVRSLLEAQDADKYHEALTTLHQASGGVGELERQD